MTPSKNLILIVEDDVELQRWMIDYLCSKGFECIATANGLEAVVIIQETKPDLVLLDGVLPGLDGVEVCKKVRHFYSGPIVMLTARDEEVDEVLGLEVGADDYLVKPVRARALLARIKKFIDLKGGQNLAMPVYPTSSILNFKNLNIDLSKQTVTVGDRNLNISSRELEVLWLLATNAGKVLTREILVKELRGYDFDGYDRSIDLRISRLRKKLNDCTETPARIKTVWGRGYIFVADTQ